MPARAWKDKLEAWNYSFSCWEEKESSVSLADIPLNLMHYCVVTLLSPHAGKWASCRALIYPDGGRDGQHEKNKNWYSFFPASSFNCKLTLPPFSPYLWTNCERKLWKQIVSRDWVQPEPSPWGSYTLKSASSIKWCYEAHEGLLECHKDTYSNGLSSQTF